jgi:hypothetical protein
MARAHETLNSSLEQQAMLNISLLPDVEGRVVKAVGDYYRSVLFSGGSLGGAAYSLSLMITRAQQNALRKELKNAN